MNIKDLREQSFTYCMHGLGAYKGVRQTNTREAFLYWLGQGVQVFELDIGKTEDNKYVAVAHTVDEKSMRRMEIFNVPKSYTEEWFMQQRLFPLSTEGLSPVSIDMFIEIMKAYPETVFMIDIFGMFTKEETGDFLEALNTALRDSITLKERILVEAYNHEMVKKIRERNFEVIYCARHEYSPRVINTEKEIHFLRENDVSFVSYPWFYTNNNPEEIGDYISNDMIVFSRTKYNLNSHKLKRMGVKVNIVAYKFDGMMAPIQMIRYFSYCVKRLIVKKRYLRSAV